MAELGIGADTLRAHMLRPDSPAARNLAALLSARRLTPAAARKVWGVADLKKSAAWGQLRLDEAPTVIASHNARALYVTHGDVGRLLVPQVCGRLGVRGRARRLRPYPPTPTRAAVRASAQEHMLLQGMQEEQVKVRPSRLPRAPCARRGRRRATVHARARAARQVATRTFADAPAKMAKMAGNAISMEANLVRRHRSPPTAAGPPRLARGG
jgi:hypothetical protein